MYKEINNKFYFSLFINNNIYTLPELEKYIRNKIKVRRIKHQTLVTKISTLKNFIIWSLVNDVCKDEDLILYLSRYLNDSERGFQIYNKIFIQELNENIEYLLIDVKPKAPATLNKDKAIIEDFLKVTNQNLFANFNLEKNIKAMNYLLKNSRHDGYGLRMNKLAQNTFLNEVSIIPNYTNSISGDIKAFPYELFNELIEIANPREKLIYLLCGACSARISQALNLTLYDIDYLNKNIWLIDPTSNDQLGLHGISRKQFLKDVYNIDAAYDKPHSKIGFKAPIPLRYKERLPLYWISDLYRELFFEILSIYKIIPESSRSPKHPFFFTTKSGARLMPQQVNVTFKNHCKKLKHKYPKYNVQLDQLGLHSLRHMFGVMMATFQAQLIMNKNKKNVPPEQIKLITKESMGHKQLSSTDIYFNRPWDLNIELAEYVVKLFDNMNEAQKYNLLLEDEKNERLKNRK